MYVAVVVIMVLERYKQEGSWGLAWLISLAKLVRSNLGERPYLEIIMVTIMWK